MLKNWCFWTVELEKTLESALDCKGIKPVHPKGNQPWIFTGRTDAEAEATILWPPDAKNWLIWKDPNAGKDWRQEEKGMTEDEMAGWHHRLDGHEFERALGVGDGQGGLACCSPWGRRVGHDWVSKLNLCSVAEQSTTCTLLYFVQHPNRGKAAIWWRTSRLRYIRTHVGWHSHEETRGHQWTDTTHP